MSIKANFYQKLSLIIRYKVYNKILLFISIYFAKFLNGKALNNPESIFLELSSVCNLACSGCPVPTQRFKDSRAKKFMEINSLKKLIDITGKKCNTFVINIWGESFLHKDIFEILNLLKFKKLIISTNLNTKSENIERLIAYHDKNLNISELIISMDGYDKDSYETYYRVGGSYSLIYSNLTLIKSSKLKENVILQFLDDMSIEKFSINAMTFSNQLDLKYKIVQMDKNFKKENSFKSSKNKCHMPYVGLYINSDMQLMSCCSDPLIELNNGNILFCNDFNEVWNGKAIRKRRFELVKNKNIYDVCKQCDGMQIV